MSGYSNSISDINGNVGIGTTNPSARLEVQGGTTISAVAFSGPTVKIGDYSGIGSTRIFSNGSYIGYSTANSYHDFSNAGSSQMRITSTGNVGIGTTEPGQKLTLSEITGDTTLGLYNTNANADNRNWTISSNTITYGDLSILQSNAINGDPVSAGTSRFHINKAGNVGIGTTSPQQKLQIASPSDTSVVLGASYLSTNNNNFFEVGILANDGYLNLRNSGVVSTVHIDSDGNSYFNGGNVGIGTTSPDRRLHVQDSAIVITKLEGTNQGSLLDLVNSNASQTYNGLRFTQGTTGKMAITHIADGTTKGYVQIGNSWAAGSEILVVDGRTSNVGIGTTSPTAKLHVVGLPTYADNATALAGGLTVGAFYHTAGVLKVVI
jgi:hypothetical protein